MIKVPLVEICTENLQGLTVQKPGDYDLFKDDYFEWRGTKLPVSFKDEQVFGGIMKTWHHLPMFQKLEYHEDYEKFIFLHGTALMPFADIENGEIVKNSLRVVKIPAGTELLIHPYKAHFMPVALGDEPVEIVVIAPEVPFIHVFSDEPFTYI